MATKKTVKKASKKPATPKQKALRIGKTDLVNYVVTRAREEIDRASARLGKEIADITHAWQKPLPATAFPARLGPVRDEIKKLVGGEIDIFYNYDHGGETAGKFSLCRAGTAYWDRGLLTIPALPEEVPAGADKLPQLLQELGAVLKRRDKFRSKDGATAAVVPGLLGGNYQTPAELDAYARSLAQGA